MKEKKNFLKRVSNSSFGFTLISILFGFIVGAIVLSIAGYNPLQAYSIIFNGIFSKPKYISYTIIYATPIILTGLSVAFAFRTGLFNIGAEGQYIIGALTAALVGYYVKLPPVIHPIVVLLVAMIAAGLWGGFAGYLKARFGIHEVIATIMLNWIAFYFNNYVVFTEGFRRPNSEASNYINDSARIDILGIWKKTDEGRAWLAERPILRDVFKSPVNIGIIIAVLLALIIWYILNKTTLGYELRAVGFNKFAAEYGGINVKKSTMISMGIAGGLAGSAGALQVMGVTRHIAKLASPENYGFDGIAVSLIGSNSPLGCVLSGSFFGGLKYGGPKIQNELGAPYEVINIMIGTIVLFIAIPKLIKIILNLIGNKRGENNA